MRGYGIIIFLGIMLAFFGLNDLMTARDGWRQGGILYPHEFGWIWMLLGVILMIWSLYGLFRHRGEEYPHRYTDEDIARAKEELTRIHLREHGKLPEPPEVSKPLETAPCEAGVVPSVTERSIISQKAPKPESLAFLWGVVLASVVSFCIGFGMMIAEVGDYAPWAYSFLYWTRILLVIAGVIGIVRYGCILMDERFKRSELRKKTESKLKTKDVSPAENSHQPPPDPKD